MSSPAPLTTAPPVGRHGPVSKCFTDIKGLHRDTTRDVLTGGTRTCSALAGMGRTRKDRDDLRVQRTRVSSEETACRVQLHLTLTTTA